MREWTFDSLRVGHARVPVAEPLEPDDFELVPVAVPLALPPPAAPSPASVLAPTALEPFAVGASAYAPPPPLDEPVADGRCCWPWLRWKKCARACNNPEIDTP